MTRYTIMDIAKKLGVTRQTIYYWIKKNWVEPKRDYRNYTVFTDKDLKSIKRWHNTLRKEAPPIKQKGKRKPPPPATPVTPRLTWEEIQKALYK